MKPNVMKIVFQLRVCTIVLLSTFVCTPILVQAENSSTIQQSSDAQIKATIAHVHKGDVAATAKAMKALKHDLSSEAPNEELNYPYRPGQNAPNNELNYLLSLMGRQKIELFEWFVRSRHFKDLPLRRKLWVLAHGIDSSDEVWRLAEKTAQDRQFDPAPLYAFSGQDRMNRARILDHALRTGFAIETQDDYGMRLIHYAAMAGNAPAIRVLLAHGAQVDPKTPKGIDTTLNLAFQSRLFMLMGTNRLTGTNHQTTINASMQAEAVIALLNAGADPNRQGVPLFTTPQRFHKRKDPKGPVLGTTPLFEAATKIYSFRFLNGEPFTEHLPFGDKAVALDLIERLLAKGAKPDAVNDTGETILQGLAQSGIYEAIPKFKTLVPKTAVVETGRGMGETKVVNTLLWACCIATEKGFPFTFEALYDSSLDLAEKCPGGGTLLSRAMTNSQMFRDTFSRLTGVNPSSE